MCVVALDWERQQRKSHCFLVFWTGAFGVWLKEAVLALHVNSTSLDSAAELVTNSASVSPFPIAVTNTASPGHSDGAGLGRVWGSGGWEVREHGRSFW